MEMNHYRATILLQQRRYEDAERELRTALALDPDNAHLQLLLCICLFEQEKIEEAENSIRQVIHQEPDNDYALYILAKIKLVQEDEKKAEALLKNAVQLAPNEADYYGLLASIYLQKKAFQQALDFAEQGLAVDSENILCLNMRSTALLKLRRKEEAFQTIEKALEKDPENEYTHVNYGWGKLERGQHKEALIHFREALRLNPNSEAAKAGLVETMKAKYWFYRMFLKYAFWMSRLSSKNQWIFIIGLYVLIRLLRGLAGDNEILNLIIWPIIILYLIFALSSWFIVPLSNLMLRLNPYGRYALDKEGITSSNFVGLSLALAAIGGLLYAATGHLSAIALLIFGIVMMIPTGSMFNPSKDRKKKTLIIYTIGLATVGLVGIVSGLFSAELFNLMAVLFGLGIFAYQWVANAMLIK
jgi:tetratricopeptide (TPR) repeat protein